ncbi:two component transcriptional regulator, LytTR family [Filimonas lacunae]|uniref:Two component transcriptional regulator, LytTR family n=1 Tax=Filimonas lacunae TaxID=477680 RepID=A0A173ME72_9BACT|nr:LytTR family DNA-binding domain-containing protein [Filimonas lacunae]BAV05893.1 two-component system response regulator [Filimonas lacunae]SIT34560.1 two component transcriptional regulator, LytTR family [Filimonas lacunae]
MIKCVIIDDEQLAINVIEMYVKKMPNLQLVGTATNPLTGIELVQQHKADVVFLDIQMDEMGGIDVMKILGPSVKVVFCTAFSEFAVTSYELDAVDYLMKPVAFSRFVKAVQRVSNAILSQSVVASDAIPDDYIFVKAEQKGKMIKINLDDIDFVEGMSNYVAFHRGKERILAYLTLKEVEERLPASHFMRVHKSYIVALRQITTIENGDLVLKDTNDRVPLSNTYKQAFMDKMKSKLMGD